MRNRSIVAVILLSIFTCGIYSLYWTYVTAEALNDADRNDPLMNFILAILLGWVTCGIYLLYWQYKFYKKVDTVTGSNNCVLNFILSIFGFAIVSDAIAQNSINEYLNQA